MMRQHDLGAAIFGKAAEPCEADSCDFEYEHDLLRQVEDWRAGKLETYSLEEVRQHLALDLDSEE
jgi:hypothetical protein